MALMYSDENYFQEWHKRFDVEGLDFPYLCQICRKFLSKKAVNFCGDADFIMINGKSYDWVCVRCCPQINSTELQKREDEI